MFDLLSTQEVSRELNISVQRVSRLCRTGELDAQKNGRAWAINKDSVYKYGLKSGHKNAMNHSVNESDTKRSNKNKKPIALSFFSGAMGLDLGIEKAGFNIKLACENEKYSRQTIALNKPKTALLGDISDYEPDDIRNAAGLNKNDEIDLVMGGPPCQAFSSAGKRKGLNDERGNVFLKYIDHAIALRPKYIVIENVRGLLSCPMEHRPHNMRGPGYPDLSVDELRGGALNFILHRLNESGYGVSFNLYNSANFGSPQTRERVIIICSRDGSIAPFLEPTNSKNKEDGLPEWKTLEECISGITNHNHINFPERRIKFYRKLGNGQNWRSLPDELKKEALGNAYYSGGGKSGFLRRLDWHKPSPTLVTHPAMPATDLAHPEENRPLSIEEYKRIQEFPDSWEVAGPLIHQYRQIGNAVPISLGFAVGSLLEKLINEKEIQVPNNFKYSRYKNTSHDEWIYYFNESRKKHEYKNRQIELTI